MLKNIAAAVIWLWLGAVAQAGTTNTMVDGNLTLYTTDTMVVTSKVFTAPRTLILPGIVPGLGQGNTPIQFADTASAVSTTNPLTIRASNGTTVNGASQIVITQPGATFPIIVGPNGYSVQLVPGMTGPQLDPLLYDFVADSRTRDIYPSTCNSGAEPVQNCGTRGVNWFVIANALAGQRYRIGLDQAIIGTRSDQYLAQSNIAPMLASTAGNFVIGYPAINDLTPLNGANYVNTNGVTVVSDRCK